MRNEPAKKKSYRRDQGRYQRFSNEQCLRPWQTVADEWFERTGQRISKQRCFQIAERAEQKIRAALASLITD